MKKRIIVFVCVAALLLLSISVVTAASTTFFTSNRDGYRWVGTGKISGNTVTAKLTGTQNSTPYLPSYDCSAKSWVRAYNTDGDVIGSAYDYGNTYAKAECSPTSYSVYKIEAEFEYNELHRGPFTLYA